MKLAVGAEFTLAQRTMRNKTAQPRLVGIEASQILATDFVTGLPPAALDETAIGPLDKDPGQAKNTLRVVEQVIQDREADSIEFVLVQVQACESPQVAFYANIDFETGEVRELCLVRKREKPTASAVRSANIRCEPSTERNRMSTCWQNC